MCSSSAEESEESKAVWTRPSAEMPLMNPELTLSRTGSNFLSGAPLPVRMLSE
jgi:hypothetical protein